MGLRIGLSNSQDAQRSLLLRNAELQTNLARLATGLRINSAADDPAGLAISEQLRAGISGLNATITNTSRAVNLVQTAEGALNEVNTQLSEIRGLVVQAGNSAVLGDTAAGAIQQQITSAIGSINRIAETTEFAGQSLLNGEFQDEQFAISANGDPATLTIPSVAADQLGQGVSTAIASLADIDVTTPEGAADALRVVDAAIDEVSSARTDLGAFQGNVLETASRSLGISRENLIISESTIRDADFADAVRQSVLSRIGLEAGILAQNISNQRTGMMLDLLA